MALIPTATLTYAGILNCVIDPVRVWSGKRPEIKDIHSKAKFTMSHTVPRSDQVFIVKSSRGKSMILTSPVHGSIAVFLMIFMIYEARKKKKKKERTPQ